MSKNEWKILKNNIILIILFLLITFTGIIRWQKLIDVNRPKNYNVSASSKVFNQGHKSKLDKNFRKKQFIGMYSIEGKRSNIVTESFGIANNYNVGFSLDTTIPIGMTQVLLNKYVLSQILNKESVSINENIHTYFSQIPESKKITLANVMNGDAALYINPQKISGLNEIQAQNYVKSHVSVLKQLDIKNNEILQMNGQVMASLIHLISGKQYSTVMNEKFRMMRLDNTIFYYNQDLGVMDAISFKRHEKHKKVLQDKINYAEVADYTWGSNNLRMSVADVKNVYKMFLHDNSMLTHKTQKQYSRTSTFKISNRKMQIRQNGFYVSIENNPNEKLYLSLIVSNYPGYNSDQMLSEIKNAFQ